MAKAITVEGLSKAYQLGDFGTGTLSRDVERFIARVRGKEDPYLRIGETNDRTAKGESDIVWCLKDLNFDIEQGDAVGIIGRNGAGKSTLLKIISRITSPTSGTIKIKGRIASLLEVGTGFHPELSGRENIYLNGAILGMRKSEIKRKFDEIVDFAGVERYIDTPVKRYSSGMYVRLAFAVAANLESEILIVDEVLAVGDAEFQKKCLGKMNDVSKGEGRTVLFVSHNINSIAQLCTTGLVMNNGLMETYGPINSVISQYLTNKTNSNLYINKNDSNHKRMFISQIAITDINGVLKKDFLHNEEIYIRFILGINTKIKDADLFVMILNERKKRVFACETNNLNHTMTLILNADQLVRGDYSLHAFINIPQVEQVDVAEDVCNFTVFDNSSIMAKHGEYNYGNVFGRYNWL